MKLLTAALLALTISLTSGFRSALAVPQPKRPAQPIRPLGIALEEWPYPHPYQLLDLTDAGQRVRMAYMVYRSPVKVSGPRQTVLLLHGKNFSGFYWDGTARALNKAGYDVVIPDQVGFGKSSKPDLPYSFELFVYNLTILLRWLHLNQVDVVGHSMGGMVAVKFAIKHPKMVHRLVLEDPIGLEDYRAEVGPVPFERLYKAELKNTCPQEIRTFYQHYFVTWKPQYEEFVEIKSRLVLSGEFPRWAAASARTYEPIFNEPIVPDLPNLKVPTLLITGKSDRTAVGKQYASPAVAKKMGNYPVLAAAAQRAIPGSKWVEMAGAAHIPHLELPAKFNATLLRFLK